MAGKMIVLDTSVLIYWTLQPARLSLKAHEAILSADSIRISSISIWEIGIKVKKGNFSLPIELPSYVERLKLLDQLEIRPVTEELWIRSLELSWKHKDPADRVEYDQ